MGREGVRWMGEVAAKGEQFLFDGTFTNTPIKPGSVLGGRTGVPLTQEGEEEQVWPG